MVETRLLDGLETSGRRVYQNFGISLDVFEFFCFGLFFSVFIFFWFLFILGPPYCGIGATIRIGRGIRFLPYAGFFYVELLGYYYKVNILNYQWCNDKKKESNSNNCINLRVIAGYLRDEDENFEPVPVQEVQVSSREK